MGKREERRKKERVISYHGIHYVHIKLDMAFYKLSELKRFIPLLVISREMCFKISRLKKVETIFSLNGVTG